MSDRLRPLERRILELDRQGVDHEEIAARFRMSPDFVDRILAWTEIPRPAEPRQRDGHTPKSRRVLALRAEGLSHEEIGRRFKRGARYAERIEDIAHLRADSGLA